MALSVLMKSCNQMILRSDCHSSPDGQPARRWAGRHSAIFCKRQREIAEGKANANQIIGTPLNWLKVLHKSSLRQAPLQRNATVAAGRVNLMNFLVMMFISFSGLNFGVSGQRSKPKYSHTGG